MANMCRSIIYVYMYVYSVCIVILYFYVDSKFFVCVYRMQYVYMVLIDGAIRRVKLNETEVRSISSPVVVPPAGASKGTHT